MQSVLDVALRASERVMEVYGRAGEVTVWSKEDNSPLTEADRQAHQEILDGLQPYINGVPLISEEGAADLIPSRCNSESFWLVDPLDGTKEFIKRNGEFTVNIALIEANRPVLGVVWAPAQGHGWVGAEGVGAWRIQEGELAPASWQPISAKAPQAEEPLCVVVSRSHPSDILRDFLAAVGNLYPKVQQQPCGSSLKICSIAEGDAHLYPRLGPTSEWDTAAADAVLRAAGGMTLDWRDGQPLRYGLQQDILNPRFLCCGVPAVPERLSEVFTRFSTT